MGSLVNWPAVKPDEKKILHHADMASSTTPWCISLFDTCADCKNSQALQIQACYHLQEIEKTSRGSSELLGVTLESSGFHYKRKTKVEARNAFSIKLLHLLKRKRTQNVARGVTDSLLITICQEWKCQERRQTITFVTTLLYQNSQLETGGNFFSLVVQQSSCNLF